MGSQVYLDIKLYGTSLDELPTPFANRLASTQGRPHVELTPRPSPGLRWLASETLACISAPLASLPRAQRAAVTMHDIGG